MTPRPTREDKRWWAELEILARLGRAALRWDTEWVENGHGTYKTFGEAIARARRALAKTRKGKKKKP